MNYALKVLFKEPFHYLNGESARMFLKFCLLYGNKPRFKKFGFRLFNHAFTLVDNMSFLWQFHDIFVKEVYKFQSNTDAPIIIDCGSNIGLSVIYLKRQFPKANLIAFEADPSIFEVQNQNIAHLEGIDARNEAVWIDEKGIKLLTNQADGAYISEKGETQVKSIRLRDFLRTFEKIDLLKLDVEGAEFDLISDCAKELKRVDKLFVEIHTFEGENQKLAALISAIESAGFRYFIENVNYQNSALTGDWKTSDTGMDMQLNLYAIRE